MTSALNTAQSDGVVDDIDEVGIWAPYFWCNADEGVWPASELNNSSTPHTTKKSNSRLMVWQSDDWNYGSENIYPPVTKASPREYLKAIPRKNYC